MSSEYEVRLDPLPDTPDLASRWQELERRSRCSFFLGWGWIACWLTLLPDRRAARLVSVHRQGRPVGLGVLVARRRLGFGPRYLYLHEVGDRRLDDLTIEYNGLLTERGLEADCLLALVRHLARRERRWSLLHLPGVEMFHFPAEALARERLDVRTRVSPTPYVDLAALRRDGRAYLQGLSANNRSAVRRTERKLERAFGPVAVTVAADPAQRLAFFDALARLHQAHWTGQGKHAGAFADPRILAFHRRLIGDAGSGARTQLVELSAGGRPLGYAYNFIRDDTVYFYQMGVDYAGAGQHGSPGLLLLSRAVELAEAEGRARFEFMAGDSRYKRALSNAVGSMVWISIDRVGWISRIRRAWQGLKHLAGRYETAGLAAVPAVHDGACAATALCSSLAAVL